MTFFAAGDVPPKLACFGASGTSAFIVYAAFASADEKPEFVGYIDDESAGIRHPDDGMPVFSLDDLPDPENTGILVVPYNIPGRRRVYERLAERSLTIVGYTGASAHVHPNVRWGEGAVVTPITAVGPSGAIGRGTISSAVIHSHHVTVGEFCTIGSGVAISGHVDIGDDVWIGTGASITNGTRERSLTIGDGAVIGVGAVVVKDVPAGAVIVSPRGRTPEEWRQLGLIGDR